MSIGPIQIVVIEFPENWSPNDLQSRVAELVDRGVVRLVDALLVTKDDDGTVIVVELEETDIDLGDLFGDLAQQLDLLSSEDAETLAEDLPPDGTALLLAFEHTWMIPVSEAIAASGGAVVADIHVPRDVVDEVLAGAGQG